MSNGAQSTTTGDAYGMMSDRAQEVYDQLLTVGKEVASAYVEAYQKTAAGIAEYQDQVTKVGWSNGLGTASGFGTASGTQPTSLTTDAGDTLRTARKRALEISEKLQEMNKRIMLAYLNACELAALAVADCQEELTATSSLELMKTVGGARVAFRREMTKACVSAAREIVG
jgi:hypothetical protein